MDVTRPSLTKAEWIAGILIVICVIWIMVILHNKPLTVGHKNGIEVSVKGNKTIRRITKFHYDFIFNKIKDSTLYTSTSNSI